MSLRRHVLGTASRCARCRAEFALLASESARRGRQVVLLAVVVSDNTGDASVFLAQHPVSYPSHRTSTSRLTGIVSRVRPARQRGDRAGRIARVHTGEYESQGASDGDI